MAAADAAVASDEAARWHTAAEGADEFALEVRAIKHGLFGRFHLAENLVDVSSPFQTFSYSGGTVWTYRTNVHELPWFHAMAVSSPWEGNRSVSAPGGSFHYVSDAARIRIDASEPRQLSVFSTGLGIGFTWGPGVGIEETALANVRTVVLPGGVPAYLILFGNSTHNTVSDVSLLDDGALVMRMGEGPWGDVVPFDVRAIATGAMGAELAFLTERDEVVTHIRTYGAVPRIGSFNQSVFRIDVERADTSHLLRIQSDTASVPLEDPSELRVTIDGVGAVLAEDRSRLLEGEPAPAFHVQVDRCVADILVSFPRAASHEIVLETESQAPVVCEPPARSGREGGPTGLAPPVPSPPSVNETPNRTVENRTAPEPGMSGALRSPGLMPLAVVAVMLSLARILRRP